MEWDDTRGRWVDAVRQPRQRRAETHETQNNMILDPLGGETKRLARRNARLLADQGCSLSTIARFMALPESRVQELLDAPST